MKKKHGFLITFFILIAIYIGPPVVTSTPLATNPSLIKQSALTATPGKQSRPAPTATPGKPSWEQRWDDLVAAAKTEGRLMIYSSNPAQTRQKVGEAFNKRFGIQIEWLTGSGSNELVQRILAERNAGMHNADVILGGTMSTMNFLKPAGLIEFLEPDLILPEVMDTTKWFRGKLYWVDKERTHLAYAAISQPAVVINTDLVKKEEIASYRDLLNPKWKGKMLMDNPFKGGGGNEFVTAMGELIMDIEFLKKFANQKPLILTDKRQEHEWIARGKNPILIGGSIGNLTQLSNAGISTVDVITPREGTWIGQSNGAISLLSKSPHPNAARLFLNWVLSKEGQIVICRASGFQSARLDVPTDWVAPWTIRRTEVKYHDTINYEYNLKKGEYVKIAKKIFKTD